MVDRLLAAARTGRSGALVIRGEAGIGKTVLLDLAESTAQDMCVLRATGVESEAELPFSGLHLLLYPFLDRLEALPGPQAVALRTAFGLLETPVPNRFLVGAATLTLLSELAGERPLLCLLDDVQWLDQASADALLFAARRLHADPIVMVFAMRDSGEWFPAPGINVLHLAGLDRGTSVTLLDEHVPGLAHPVRERIIDESGGNPLALMELAAAFSAQERVADFHVGPLPVTGRVQDAFRTQIDALPPATRLVLLVAAADDTASLAVILRAGDLLGTSAADLEPAERHRLILLAGDALTFRHPLIRAATYQGAPHSLRIAVHRALAQVLEADRRAWHLAAATTGPDEQVAAELEQAAQRAQHRGGSTAVAAAYERAAQLSSDPTRAAHRTMNAARAAYDAGRPAWATRLAIQAASLIDDPIVAAEAAFIRAQVEYEQTSPAAAAAMALGGAVPIVQSDPRRAVSMLTEAVWCARDAVAHEVVRRCVVQLEAVQLPANSSLSPVVDGLIGFGKLLDGETGRAVALMRSLVRAAERGTLDGFVERVIAGFLGLLVADDESAVVSLESLVADLRAQGALGWLPYAMEPLTVTYGLRGSFRDAQASVAEAVSLANDIGQTMQGVVLDSISAWLAAVTGDGARCRSLADRVLEHRSPHPTNAALAVWALGLLDLAEGRSEAAMERLDEVCGGVARHDFHIRAVPDWVEAAVYSGQNERARSHLPALDDWATHTERPLAMALSRRCHALLGTDDDPEGHYTAALLLHRSDDRPYDRARTQLVYGEWLRRQRRRSDARAQLTACLDTFERLGATPWARRARTELGVLGERPTARANDADVLTRLTPQELQVVRLAATGLSNREIGAQLYLSPRTVGHHLYKAYPKIGVTKRMELALLGL